MQIRAILLDFGDTVVLADQFDYDACLRKLHRSLARDAVKVPYKDFKEIYFEVRGRLYRETEETLREAHFCIRISETLRHFGYSLKPTDPLIIRAADAFGEAFVQHIRMEKCVPTILKQLHSNYLLGLVSNFAYSPALRKTLERFDITKFFDAIIISGEVGWRKPSSKIFQKALDALSASASETVFVGDMLHMDIEGAKRMGMKTVLVKETVERPELLEEIEKVKPQWIISKLDELQKILQNI
ncbi:MAG: HAD family hydrolase [Thermoproteota archaeon]|nr:HAD family hydrolase [Thermoproteota archaeon]